MKTCLRVPLRLNRRRAPASLLGSLERLPLKAIFAKGGRGKKSSQGKVYFQLTDIYLKETVLSNNMSVVFTWQI